MKLKKALLLSLLSISLMGCQSSTGTDPNPDSSQTGNVDNGSSNTGGDSNTGGNSSTGGGTDDNTGGNSGGTNTNPDDDKKDDGDIYSKTKWSKDVVDAMLKYLGGQIIPYVNLGTSSSISATYVGASTSTTDPYLLIDALKEYDITVVSKAITDYEAEGWSVVGQGNGFNAMKGSLKVNLVESAGLMQLKVYYDEPYDITAATDWTSEIKELFNCHLDKHSIPYFYLGTATPYYLSWSKTNKTTIYGNGWRDEMVDNAVSVFEGLEGWTHSEGQDSNGAKTMTATFVSADDGCKITLYLYNMSVKYPRAALDVKFKEGFNASEFTAWNKEATDVFKAYMDEHELPLIYLGSNNPTVTYDDSLNEATITGGYWDDQVISMAQSVLEKDVDSEGNPLWSIEITADKATLTATRVKYDDECKIAIKISGSNPSNPDTNMCELIAYYTPSVDFPADESDWNTNVKNVLNGKFSSESSNSTLDGHELPYIYLGGNAEARVTSNTVRFVTITGGSYNPNYIEKGIETYKAKGWTVNQTSNVYGFIGFEATKKFHHDTTDSDGNTVTDGDTSHDCEITVKIAPGVSYSDNMYMYVYYNEGFGLYDYTAYDSSIQSDLKTYFNGFSLPVFYLGSSWLRNSYDDSTNTETLIGGAWDDSLYTSVEQTLTADTGWTITKPDMNDTTPTLTATKLDGENGTVTVKLFKGTTTGTPYSYPKMTIQYVTTFASPANGSWSSSTLSNFATYFGYDSSTGANEIPYIYLHVGNQKETSAYTKSGKYITVTGGQWDNRIYTLAETSFKKAGWNTYSANGTYYKQLIATKKNDDGTFYRIKLDKSSADTSAVAKMVIYQDAAVTIDNSGTWSSNAQTNMKKVLNGTVLPYFDLGTSGTFQIGSGSSTNYTYFYYTTSRAAVWNTQYVDNAAQILEKDGWTIEINYVFNNFSSSLTATKTTADGMYSLILRGSGSDAYQLACFYLDDFSGDTVEGYDLSSSAKETVKDVAGIELPAIYLGLSSPSVTPNYSTSRIIINGKGYSKTLLTDAEAAFKADTKNNWTVSYQNKGLFTYANSEVLSAETTNAAGQKVTVYIYQYISVPSTPKSTYYSYPTMRVYVA